MGNLLEHMGIEKERLHFSWVSSAEATKFVEVAKKVTAAVRSIEPNDKLVKKLD